MTTLEILKEQRISIKGETYSKKLKAIIDVLAGDFESISYSLSF